MVVSTAYIHNDGHCLDINAALNHPSVDSEQWTLVVFIQLQSNNISFLKVMT